MRKFYVLVSAIGSALTLTGPASAQASLDVTVDARGTEILVYSGEARVCNLSGECEVVQAGCGVVAVSGDEISLLEDSAKLDFITENFPLVLDQAALRPEFHVDSAACGNLPQVPLFIQLSPFEPGAIDIPTLGAPASASPG